MNEKLASRDWAVSPKKLNYGWAERWTVVSMGRLWGGGLKIQGRANKFPREGDMTVGTVSSMDSVPPPTGPFLLRFISPHVLSLGLSAGHCGRTGAIEDKTRICVNQQYLWSQPGSLPWSPLKSYPQETRTQHQSLYEACGIGWRHSVTWGATSPNLSQSVFRGKERSGNKSNRHIKEYRGGAN